MVGQRYCGKPYVGIGKADCMETGLVTRDSIHVRDAAVTSCTSAEGFFWTEGVVTRRAAKEGTAARWARGTVFLGQ
jgi:hypothetical protein